MRDNSSYDKKNTEAGQPCPEGRNGGVKHVLCGGEILYDFLSTTPGAGLAKSETFERRPGGSPFNIAVGLARLGRKTGFLVKLGTDEFGLELKRLLLSEGLEPGYLVDGAGQNTTLAMAAMLASSTIKDSYFRLKYFANTCIIFALDLCMCPFSSYIY